MITFGIHSIEMLLKKNPKKILRLYVQKDRQDKRIETILKLAQEHRIFCEKKDSAFLAKLAESEKHQGIVAEMEKIAQLEEQDLFDLLDALKVPAFSLILDGVQDPHNLGACLRTADAAGVQAVIAPKDRAVSITPVVQKVASGAAETMPFIQVTNLVRTMEALKERGIWLVGSAGEATQTLYDIDLKGNIAIIAGNEGDGMRRLTKERCDFLVNIPMLGSVSSLNVSVATGVLLFEALRQRLI